MKKIVGLMPFLLVGTMLFSQDLKKFNLYHPEENASKGIAEAVKKAKAEKKHVFIQIGGNWCIWCARFHEFITKDSGIDSLIRDNYIVYHLNYSKENQNKAILAKYGYPQRFGFPVFLILDGKGELLHTQNTSYLEDGNKGYNRNAVIGFLKDWSPAALDPQQYQEP